MSWDIQFRNRQDQPARAPERVWFTPQRYSWHAIGGPDWAEIRAEGDALDVWRLIGWLRYPVTLCNARQQPVWWGYVESVSVASGAIRLGVSLESMYNRVAVVYSFVEPGTQSVGTRATTTWAQHEDSVAEYGVKEHLASVDGATPAQAESARDTILAQHQLPVPFVEMVGDSNVETVLFCRGWWHTLDWRYYAQPGTSSVPTTTQIANIIQAAGVFFTGADMLISSGLSASEYRKGDSTARAAIQELLKTGTATHRRLLAHVTPARIVRVDAEPDAVAELVLRPDGRVADKLGQPLPAGEIPVGQWIALQDIVPATATFGHLASPTPFFVERGEYDVMQNRLVLEPRGLPSPWDISRIAEG